MAIGQTTDYSSSVNNSYELMSDSNGTGWYMAGPASSDPSNDWTDITGASDVIQTFEYRTAASTIELDTSSVWKELSDRMKNIEDNIKDPCVYCGRDFEPDPKYPGECIRCGGPRHVEISSEELKELAKRIGQELEAIRKEREGLQREREKPYREVSLEPSWSYGTTMNWGGAVCASTSATPFRMFMSTGGFSTG